MQGISLERENGVRIAMIAFTLYSFDPRVKRAAEALTESGHQVEVFTLACDGLRANGNGGPFRLYSLRFKKKQTGLARYVFEYCAFFLRAFVRVTLLQARRRYDVVYVHNMPNFLVFA